MFIKHFRYYYYKYKLEFKNLLLTEKLDLDYIETLIRQKFLYGKKGETLYIINNNDN